MIKFYNALSRKKELFKPLQGKEVRIYNCGVTPYDHCHLRHARAFVIFDVLRSYLKYKKFNVFYVQNITDAGDLIYNFKKEENRIEERSRIMKICPKELVDIYTKSMWEDLDTLKVDRPEAAPRITEHIREIVDAIQNLINKGLAYESRGYVYFDLGSFLRRSKNTDFGKLSQGRVKSLLTNIGIKPPSLKKHEYDFLLWKKAGEDTVMRWRSPWGKGCPGWHIGCFLVSTKYLGQPFDIHGGGIEHALLHHECEIAIAEGITRRKFVKYWLHTGFLNIGGRKISRLSGDFITIKEILKKYNAEAIRLLMLSTPYRNTMNYTEKNMKKVIKNLDRLNIFTQKILTLTKKSNAKKRGDNNKRINKLLEKVKLFFNKAMEDDLNTPKVLDKVFDFITKVDRYVLLEQINKEEAIKIYGFLKTFNSIFKILNFN